MSVLIEADGVDLEEEFVELDVPRVGGQEYVADAVQQLLLKRS